MDKSMEQMIEAMLGEAPKFESVKFPTVGTTFSGVVKDQEVQQQTEYNPDGPGAPMFWPDGKPKMQLVLTVTDDSDGQEKRMYLRSGLLKAARTAIRQSGLKSFTNGTKIKVTYTGDAANRMKEYSVQVEAPDAAAAVLAEDDPAPAIKVEAANLPPEAVEALRKAGMIKA